MLQKTNLLNRSAVVKTIRAVLAERRPHLAEKFTRIDSQLIAQLDKNLYWLIVQRVDMAPTVGKTLR